jgi:DNA polymerase-3 subunit epsilon
LERLTSRLPRSSRGAAFDAYYELLDDVFADSVLEAKEALSLFLLAAELGMSQEDTQRAHRAYLQGLLQVAYQDGYYTEMEAEHLEAVARALQVDELVLSESGEKLPLYPRDLKGKRVCFSGSARGMLDGRTVTRARMKELAEAAGLSVDQVVTEKTDFLVVTEPEAESGKALNTKRVSEVREQVFWNWLGIQVR